MKRKYLLESFGAYKDNYKQDPFQKEDNDEVADAVSNGLQHALDDKLAEDEEEDMEEDMDDMDDDMEDEEGGMEDEAPMRGGFGGGAQGGSKEPVAQFAFRISTSTNNDTPSQPAMTFKSEISDSASTSSFKRPEWAVTRVMTNNGERVAMEYQNSTDCEVLADNLSYEEAEKQSTEFASKLSIPEYNNEMDQFIGKVSSKVVRRPAPTSGSYKY